MHLDTYRNKSLSIEDRVKELEIKVSELGYIPELGESRFTDGTDMFTWYTKYKKNFPHIIDEVNKFVKEEPTKKVNIYTIPTFENTGNFYDIYRNVNEHLDITEITSYEELKEKDNAIEKGETNSLKPNEEISFIDIKKGIIK